MLPIIWSARYKADAEWKRTHNGKSIYDSVCHAISVLLAKYLASIDKRVKAVKEIAPGNGKGHSGSLCPLFAS